MRNKIILAMAAAGMMCATSAFADAPSVQPPTLATAHITVTGTINNSPCDIKSGDDNLIVAFGQFSNRHLQAAGQPADAKYNKDFAIHLENCSFDTDSSTQELKMSKVAVSFSAGGGVAAPENGIFPNSQDPGMAKNVGVQFLDDKGQVIKTGNTNTQQLAQGSNQINLTAQLVNTGGAGSVTTGQINIPLTYTLTYS
ncbi:fimbrial protein StdA [Salmonella enterica]|uniref:fimbrial protein n=1 Tax=Salmonella enterica TaxID=28901 RepID=UPI0009AC7FCD|nr:fimbrial protein [Salmonella enterica]EBB6196974.1 fimbrial protein StdA [Salmonella enterica]